MNELINFQRRRLLQHTGWGAAAFFAGSNVFAAVRSLTDSSIKSFRPDVEIALIAQATQMDVFPGPPTKVLKFSADLIKGPKGTVEQTTNNYLGPVLRLRQGQKVRIHYRNELSNGCIVHWHGLHVPEKADGHPRYVIDGGQTYVYEFEVKNRAGTYWYHSHTHRITGQRVYQGLAGVLLVTDENEQSLSLPSGNYDIPLVIQDRRFDSQNQLSYVRHMRERMTGFLGDRIVVNGRPDFELPVATRAYRLRLLNLSNSRIYKLAWEDDTPMTVIGTDGGLLEKPEQRAYVMLAPSERVDIWMDFSSRKVGSKLEMLSQSFSATMPMMGRGMMRGRGGGMRSHGMHGGPMGMPVNTLSHGGEYSVLQTRVVKKESGGQQLPKHLSNIPRYRVNDAVNAKKPKAIRLAMRPLSPTLNGRSFEMNSATPFETVRLNSLYLMEFVNRDPMMHGMIMAHPMHIHGQQFQVVKREIAPDYEHDYQSVRAGFVDNGWKDTVLVMPGEKVTILKRFDDYPGLFLYHCHNLEHEDLDMMRNFLVQS